MAGDLHEQGLAMVLTTGQTRAAVQTKQSFTVRNH